MPSLLDDAYTTSDLLARLRPKPKPETMPIETLSGRERRRVQAPEYMDPYEATQAMGTGMLAGPMIVGGSYSPELRQYHDYMLANYPTPYMIGAAGPIPGVLRGLSMLPRAAQYGASALFGLTGNPRTDKDQR